MNWKVIGAILMAIIIIGAIVAYTMWNKPHADYESMNAEVKIEASTLFDEFNDGGEDAVQKYKGKIIEMTGIIEDISESSDSSQTILIKAENAEMGGVNARLAKKYKKGMSDYEKIANLTEGEPIKLKCRCLGFEDDLISEVKMDNCFLISK